ncbi:hypothetical protein VNO78_09959 [Psophocarpus tetragonolobus]|uniref:Uncharacterized protein n=1 Tax=Psophocarpus tetragonolobus TaxID=3891 RepID=A0AAN9XM33_PSOTE
MVGCDVSSVSCIASFIIIAKKVCCERDRHLARDGRFMPQPTLINISSSCQLILKFKHQSMVGIDSGRNLAEHNCVMHCWL